MRAYREIENDGTLVIKHEPYEMAKEILGIVAQRSGCRIRQIGLRNCLQLVSVRWMCH